MRLLNRIRTLLSASLNDLLDGLEDPETMINQLIRDMERSIRELRQEVQTSLTQRNLTAKRLQKTKADIAKWQGNAELAIAQDREDLARQALVKKHETQATADSLKEQLKAVEASVAELKDQLHAMEDKIQDARRKRETLLARQSRPASKQPQDIIKGFEQFARYEDELSRQTAVNESARDVQQQDLEQEFAAIRRQQALDAELEKLKSKKQS